MRAYYNENEPYAAQLQVEMAELEKRMKALDE